MVDYHYPCLLPQERMGGRVSLHSRVYHYPHIFLMESNRSCASFETPTPLALTSLHLASMFCSILLLTRCRLISGRGGAVLSCGARETSSRSETCSRLITCTLVPNELSSSGVKRSRKIVRYHTEVLHSSCTPVKTLYCFWAPPSFLKHATRARE